MMFRRIALSAFVLAFAGVGYGQLRADEAKTGDASEYNCILDAVAAKLGLSAAQKEQIRKTHSEYDQKSEILEHQIWTVRHEEHEALSKLLTNEQRAELPSALKTEIDHRLQDVAAKLGLNDEQRQRIEKIRAEYAPKFHELMGQKGAKEQGHKFHQLRKQEFEALCMELNDEQRTRLPAILKEEFRNWRLSSAKAEFRKEIADKLGLNTEQRQQCEKIHSEYEPRLEKLHIQLRQLWKDEHAAVRQLLNEKQQTQFDQLMKHGEKGTPKTQEQR